MWLVSKPITDQNQRSRKTCVQCEIWRELYESEKQERRDLQHLIFLRFGVMFDPAGISTVGSTSPIQNHRPSQALRDLEIKKRREALEEIKRLENAGALNQADNATES